MMIRTILVAAAALASVGHAEAANAPWCAVIDMGTGDVHWECHCYRRGNILAGNRGFCNHSPYYGPGYAEQRQTRKRRAY
jgi:hypothetical protein